MDGVIVDNMKYHRKAWEIFLSKYSPDLNVAEFSRNFGKANQDLMTIVFDREVSLEEAGSLGEEKEALYRRLYTGKVKPIPGLEKFLKTLKKSRKKIAVASAAPRKNVDFVLDALKFRKYFDAVVDADDVQKGKPDPEIYLKVADAVGCKPRSCLVFEDSFPGIQSALNAGMRVIGVKTTYSSKELQNTEKVIEDFTEVDLSVLEEMFN